jgi:hypothetical protein
MAAKRALDDAGAPDRLNEKTTAAALDTVINLNRQM